MPAASCVSEGSTPDVLGEKLSLAKNAEEFRPAFRFRKKNDRLVATAKLDIKNVRAPHACILEADACDFVPTKCLTKLRVHSFDYSAVNSLIIEFDLHQFVQF